MIFISTFFLNESGLFDFDLTFLAEIFEFLFLSLMVTIFFVNPISKELDERAEYINYRLRKSNILLTLGYEKLSTCIYLLTSEIRELKRQIKITRNQCNSNFENEIALIQKENIKLLSQLKGDLAIKSISLFLLIKEDLMKISETFFVAKYKQEPNS
uniref:ATP synthase CF0 B' subunit n=1 Tax=Neotessella volvocina TaxID=52559 RepID=A0A3G2R0K6_9STRA|nr:ATP synthase CF0 B' subunit [Neotessella volvocina]